MSKVENPRSAQHCKKVRRRPSQAGARVQGHERDTDYGGNQLMWPFKPKIEAPKLCIDCKHMVLNNEHGDDYNQRRFALCKATIISAPPYHLISPEMITHSLQFCSVSRHVGKCGNSAKLWEPKA